MKLLLINPRFPESFWSFRWAVREILPGKKTVNPPLGLATLAALCPRGWQVTIVDENVESIPLAPEADIVGVCGMGVQFPRQRELLDYYRRNGYYAVAGGSFASLCPERLAPHCDTVVAGEAEYIWPQFCADFGRGSPQALYRETGTVALADSPAPRFDLLKLDRYTTATLQFSRGCPYRCEFCDIIVMFGRKPRHKNLAQVERELDALRLLGAHNVFFVDDNLIGHRAVARDLLHFLKDYQARHGHPFRFGTEVSLNLAQDRELLQLFRAARFEWVFIGIESSDPETLRATLKTQNLHEDALPAVRRIYAHGIDVLAGFIVGFDNDTLDTFPAQHAFIMDSGIQAAMVGLLTALPHTPLHARLAREGRLRRDAEDAGDADNTRPHTNVQPRNMSYAAMVAAYEALYRGLLTDRNIATRIRNKLSRMASPVYHGEYPFLQRLGIVARLVAKGILRGGPRRWAHFLRSLPLAAPDKLPLAIVDWIAGLSMRNYVERYFSPVPARRLDRLLGRIAVAVERGRMQLTVTRHAAAGLALELRVSGACGRRRIRRVARRLARLLAETPATLVLRIEALHSGTPGIDYLLGRLARYGDRISVVLDRRLRDIVRIDSSVFHLVLTAPGTGAISPAP